MPRGLFWMWADVFGGTSLKRRGSYGFDVGSDGRVVSNRRNVRLLSCLLLDWKIIEGDGGPGTSAEDHGAWHLFCHLAAGAAVFRMPGCGGAWAGITYDLRRQRYVASLCCTGVRRDPALRLLSPEATTVLKRATWGGFLEGASRGRILDRNASDPGDPATVDRRQDYDQNPNSSADGGPVWEMWCASRDIRTSRAVGHSLVSAYVDLLSVLGGRFASVVARGRMEPEYGHLRQMCAMVDAGLIAVDDALCEIEPAAIPPINAMALLEATPAAFARAAAGIGELRSRPAYYMYERRITSFASTALLRRLVRTLGSSAPGTPSNSTP